MSRRRSTQASLLLMISTAGTPACGQQDPVLTPITTDRPARTGARELTFDSLATLYPSGKTTLVNGSTEINVTAWPALVIARLDSSTFCTATIVGPRVLLTAAHCIDAGFGSKGDVIGGRVNVSNSQFELIGCEMHEDYVKAERQALDIPRADVDYALCELDGSPSIVLETLATGSGAPIGSPLLMTGFGCTGISVVSHALSFAAADAPGSERLRMGDEKVDQARARDHTTATGVYVRTRSDEREPILCPGDSGGPAITGATLATQAPASRRLAGVNSMVTAIPVSQSDEPVRYAYLSFMASVATPEFRSFLEKWKAKAPTTRVVCGIHITPGQRNCRG